MAQHIKMELPETDRHCFGRISLIPASKKQRLPVNHPQTDQKSKSLSSKITAKNWCRMHLPGQNVKLDINISKSLLNCQFPEELAKRDGVLVERNHISVAAQSPRQSSGLF